MTRRTDAPFGAALLARLERAGQAALAAAADDVRREGAPPEASGLDQRQLALIEAARRALLERLVPALRRALGETGRFER